MEGEVPSNQLIILPVFSVFLVCLSLLLFFFLLLYFLKNKTECISLLQAQNRMNSFLVANSKLREQIDHIKAERNIFESIFGKLERRLNEQKKQMASVIEKSNQVIYTCILTPLSLSLSLFTRALFLSLLSFFLRAFLKKRDRRSFSSSYSPSYSTRIPGSHTRISYPDLIPGSHTRI